MNDRENDNEQVERSDFLFPARGSGRKSNYEWVSTIPNRDLYHENREMDRFHKHLFHRMAEEQ